MSNVKLDVRKDSNGKVDLYKGNNVVTTVTIKKDVDMEIDVGSGFGASAMISAFTLYNETNGAKGTTIGTWHLVNPGAQPSTEISVAANGNGVQVTDTDRNTDEELFFFSVQVNDNGTLYDTDPQLKVKKATG